MALIMILDSQKDGCSLLARVLSGRGHEVLAFEESGLAVEWLAAHTPDLVILDLDADLVTTRPCSILDIVRERETPPGVIALTGKPLRENLVRNAGLHVDEFLIKPVELDELEELVRLVLGNRT